MAGIMCRGCGSAQVEVFFSLGRQPLANALLPEADHPHERYPLDVALCLDCALVQLTVSVDPEQLFGEYAYFSSYSPTLVASAGDLVKRLTYERGLGEGDLAIEVASNDGYLLQHYIGAGVPALGIEPARNIAEVAEAAGIPTMCAFFGVDLAAQLRAQGQRASVLHANNVLAHVPDINGFLQGIAAVLRDDGVAVIETPYVVNLVEQREFDTIYHEHLFYYSLTALRNLVDRAGLTVLDVERIPLHGGSLRVFMGLAGSAPAAPGVSRMLAEEATAGLDRLAYFQGFAGEVQALCSEVRALVDALLGQGRRLAAYGAAAKGTVLLNALDLGPDTIEFVVDRSPHKQGRYIPGVCIPVRPPDALLNDSPDDVLLLAWNYADEIIQQCEEFRRRGGHFVIPLPTPRIVAAPEDVHGHLAQA